MNLAKNNAVQPSIALVDEIIQGSGGKVGEWIKRPMVLRLKREIYAYKEMQEKLALELERAREENQKLRNLSYTDELTKIPNRRAFKEFAAREWRLALREKKPLSLIMVDIDFFKKFNDSLGHQQGDSCLIKVAQTMSGLIHRPEDIVARIGGEEFAVVLGNTGQEKAPMLAEKLRAMVEKMRCQHIFSEVSDVVTISVGVSSIFPSRLNSLEQLIENADKALYLAKDNGRNRVESLSVD